jgi:hypothetical protein
MVRVVLERSNLLAHYENEKEGADRIENLEQMVNAATQFVQEEGFGQFAPAHLGPQAQAQRRRHRQPGRHRDLDADAPLATVMSPLSAFLAHASLEAGDAQAQAGQDAMQLMTVHSAKGLEFDAVFITGLEEGLFPHESSSRELDGVDEERRLMYVAITRARKRLYMSFTQQRMLHGQTRFNMKSRFFDELPEEALKWLSPRVQTNWFANKNHGLGRRRLPRRRQRQPDRQADHAEVGAATAAGWRIGESVSARQVRRGRDREYRRRRRQCARPDQLRRGRDEGAGFVGGQAGADRAVGGRRARPTVQAAALFRSLTQSITPVHRLLVDRLAENLRYPAYIAHCSSRTNRNISHIITTAPSIDRRTAPPRSTRRRRCRTSEQQHDEHARRSITAKKL